MSKKERILLYILGGIVASIVVTALYVFLGIQLGALPTLLVYGFFVYLCPKALMTYLSDKEKEKQEKLENEGKKEG